MLRSARVFRASTRFVSQQSDIATVCFSPMRFQCSCFESMFGHPMSRKSMSHTVMVSSWFSIRMLNSHMLGPHVFGTCMLTSHVWGLHMFTYAEFSFVVSSCVQYMHAEYSQLGCSIFQAHMLLAHVLRACIFSVDVLVYLRLSTQSRNTALRTHACSVLSDWSLSGLGTC